MAWECQAEGDRERARSDDAKKDCRRFLELLEKDLSSSGGAGTVPAAMADLAGGSRVTPFDCFSGDQGGEAMVEAMEAYTACMASHATNPVQAGLDGSSVSSSWSGTAPAVPGYEHVSSTETVRNGPNGNTGTQVAHEYKGPGGESLVVTDYSTIVNGEESSGTFVATDDGRGNTRQENRNPQGEVTESFTQHSDGKTETFQRNDDGSAVAVTTDADGVSTIEITDAEGNVKTATVEENGNCTGAACDASTPVDDMGTQPACTMAPGNPRGSDPVLSADPLGPYIYPSPDAAVGDPLLTCLIGGSSGKPGCPPSVALCVEPPPQGSCDCGRPRPDTPERSFGARCQRMTCADGTTCHPETGVCGASSPGGLVGLSPGMLPPRPGSTLDLPRIP